MRPQPQHQFRPCCCHGQILLLLMGCMAAFTALVSCMASSSSSSLPWLLPPTSQLPYDGLHNDLTALLETQRTPDNWVSIFMFSAGVKWWTMNSIHSYIAYGKSTAYILASPDEASLEACLSLRLPCLNMSAAGIGSGGGGGTEGTEGAGSGAHSWRSAPYYTLVWAKVNLVDLVDLVDLMSGLLLGPAPQP